MEEHRKNASSAAHPAWLCSASHAWPQDLTAVTAENQRDHFLAMVICMTSKAKFHIIQRMEISWWICLAAQFPSGNSSFSPAQDRKGPPQRLGGEVLVSKGTRRDCSPTCKVRGC